MATIVIVDTNAIHTDYQLSAPIWRSESDRAGLKLCLPKVVFEEIVKHYRRDLRKKLVAARTELKALKGFLTPIQQTKQCVDLPEWDLDALTNEYRRNFEMRVAAFGGEICKTPNVTHERLIERAIKEMRPFDQNGKGYVDALIWETVLACAAESDVILVSNDGDYGKEDVEFHEDYRKDTERGIAHKISRVRSLGDLLSKHIEPDLQKLNELGAQLAKGTFEQLSLTAWLAQNGGDAIASSSIHPAYFDKTADHLAEIQRARIGVMEPIEFVDARRLAPGKVLITFTVKAEVVVDAVLDPKDLGLEFNDGGDQYVRRQRIHGTEQVEFRLVFDETTNEVVSAEADALYEEPPWYDDED